jgi:threonine/homoserine/homoserine lactone efflux protein
MSLSFLLTSLIVIVSPGTGVLYTLAAALTRGSCASIAAAFGCTLGIVPHMVAAMLGLAAVLHTSGLAFAALKWCGVIYLLYMAWQALRERGALAVDTRLDARSSRRVIVTGFLINILNPKLSIFFLAFLPQFIAADQGHALLRMLELSGVFMAMTFAVFVLYGLFAAGVRDRIVTRPKVMLWLRRRSPAASPRSVRGWRLRSGSSCRSPDRAKRNPGINLAPTPDYTSLHPGY